MKLNVQFFPLSTWKSLFTPYFYQFLENRKCEFKSQVKKLEGNSKKLQWNWCLRIWFCRHTSKTQWASISCDTCTRNRLYFILKRYFYDSKVLKKSNWNTLSFVSHLKIWKTRLALGDQIAELNHISQMWYLFEKEIEIILLKHSC